MGESCESYARMHPYLRLRILRRVSANNIFSRVAKIDAVRLTLIHTWEVSAFLALPL